MWLKGVIRRNIINSEIIVLMVLTPEGFLRGKAEETYTDSICICGQVSVFLPAPFFVGGGNDGRNKSSCCEYNCGKC